MEQLDIPGSGPKPDTLLPAEDVAFLTGGPKEVAEVARNHSNKFVSGGLQVRDQSELMTQPGLHPGSHVPVHTEQRHHQGPEAGAAAESGAPELQLDAGGSKGGSGSGSAAARHAAVAQGAGGPQGEAAAAAPEPGFLFGQAAESLDFASEEMDAE